MKLARLVLVPLLLFVFASYSYAEGEATSSPAKSAASKPSKTPEEKAQAALAKWKTTLNLTAAQEPQFESIMTASYRKMAEAKTSAAGDKTKMKASMATLMKERQQALSKVLTPEQMKTYEAEVAKSAKKHMEHMDKSSTKQSG
jgi:Spy/CpxP family protein refolding chaperone